ncbi:MAG TPA: adenylate/guanylate cyclase domain-containing protein, partial [bacterium]|nr:adenylate/guanylate cyclase domain-containing protein [bacterium]
YFPEKQTILENGKEIKVSPIYLENKILMIGLTGIGTIDLNPMPFEQNCPMVALHTNALNLLLTRQPLYFTPVWYKYLTPIILAFIIAILSMRLNALSGSIAAIIISILYTLLIWTGWTKFNTWLSFVTPMISIYLTYLIIALYKFLQSSAERKKIRNIFSTMVSPAVLKVMEDNPDLLSLKGERMPATMSFSMVNGFANVAATVAPENLTKILSFYLTPVSEIIMDYDGYIDKYEGHIIMADFGVPIADPDNPWKCAYAAVEHQLDVKAFQYYIYANYAANVYTTLGLNFGYVSAGNMGSEKKMQYTVMGDAVNVAARFMPANIIYNTRVITGGATYYKIKDFVELRKLDKLLLKGKTTPTQIYEVLGWNKEQYLKLLANKPVPESLLTRWRFAPAAKVFGYHKFWQDMEKDFSHPLIKRFREFFESQLVLNANIFELHNKIVFLELYQELNKVIEKYNITYTHQKISDYSKLFEDWLDKVIKPLLDQLKTDTNKIEEFFNVQLFENKLNNFKEKIELKENINELLLLAYSRTKEYMSKFNYDNSVAELDLFIAEYDKLSEQYRNSVQEFFDKIKLEPQEYRNMMAEIGSITEAKRKVRDIYEQSMEKYYNRQWD